jgi:hypothetical protein
MDLVRERQGYVFLLSSERCLSGSSASICFWNDWAPFFGNGRHSTQEPSRFISGVMEHNWLLYVLCIVDYYMLAYVSQRESKLEVAVFNDTPLDHHGQGRIRD